MKKYLAASLLLMAFLSPAIAAAKRTAKPLHKNTPHTYTKHQAAKHSTTIHPRRKS